ncbi:RidA family protein [Gracilimonas sp.]|uniref:RidA family protein n=1 Tax=Gracilimonas sp. TaxID=1974203 RepID=UPI0028718187|nr:RidA family protein [Gracilimonas sp.]
MRQNISTGTEWEDKVGYSRAVRIGNHIAVSGTTAVDSNGTIVGKNDVYKQTLQCFRNIEKALKQAGSSLKDVVRTRTFITNIENWEDFGRAHAEVMGGIKPVATLVEVSKLIDPDLLIEIEVDAIIGSDNNKSLD